MTGAAGSSSPAAGDGGPGVRIWPYALGAVSMVLAAQALLGLAGMMVQILFAVVLGGGELRSLLGGLGPGWQMVQMGQQVLRPVLGAVLLAAGLLVWRRSRLGVTLHVAYAIAAILLAASFPIAYVAMAPSRFLPQIALGPIWHSTTSLIYPVFVLVWFNRAGIKSDVRAWGR